MGLSSNANPRRHPNTAYRSVGDDGGLVVIADQAQVKVLNPVGIKIYSMLDGEHTEDEIVRAVTDEFDVSLDEATTHLSEFLAELKSNGMLAAPGERAPWEEGA